MTWQKALAKKSLCLILLIMIITSACSSHKYPKGEIDAFDKVLIGEMEQWIMINGKSKELPVLLWLHGVPGAGHIPIARYFNSNLEQEFIVVHWDQRGAGKSNPQGFDESTMTFERFVADVYEMTQYLRNRFNKEKIYLLGHSWGSQLGLVVAHRYPQYYFAFIGVSQVADGDEAQIIAQQELVKRIKVKKKDRDLKKLQDLDGPPYRNHTEYVSFARMMGKYGMNMDVGMGKLMRVAFRSGVYSLADFRKWLRGANRGSGEMWEETQGVKMIDKVANIETPYFIITSDEDFNTPMILAERLLNQIESSQAKEIIVFEGAAHTPFFALPERFFTELKRIKTITYKRSDDE